jgi:hypothetical protein
MRSIVAKIFKINELHVVGVMKRDGAEEYYVLTVRKRKNKIEIIDKNIFDSAESLVKKVDIRLPIILVIDGKGVLNKEVNFNEEQDVNWHKNIDFSTIYYTSIKGLKSTFMSFCRKNLVFDSQMLFEKNGFQIADIYVGSMLSALLHPTINKESILSGDLDLRFTSGQLSGAVKQVSADRVEYVIGKDSISNVFLPLYGALIHFFIQSKDVARTDTENLKSDEIIYKKAFNTVGMTIMAGFFVALLASYSLIQYYGSQNAALSLQKVYSAQSYKIILDLEKQRGEKQGLLNESGLLSKNFLSFYAYEIIKKIPSDINLNQLGISPLDKEVKANKKMMMDSRRIILKGETYNESSFNNWIQNLKEMLWLRNFEITSFKKNKKNKSLFEITITIKDV